LGEPFVNLDFTDDQQVLHDTLQDFFEKESPVTVVRAAEPFGYDSDLWRKVVQLGIVCLALPEDLGGGGGGMLELGLAAELLGRSLAPVPFIEAAVATTLLGTFADRVDLTPVISGEELPTIAIHPVVGDEARFVPAGAVADVVVALRGEELVLASQPVKPAALVPNLGAAPVAHCDVRDATVLAAGREAAAAYERAVRQWEALMGLALIGLGRRALEIGVEYVLQRKAFGVQIALFQTIQHRLADDATALDGGRLLAYKAAWAQDAAMSEASALATMSLLFASEAAFKTASDSLHFHGGYGYTLEYDIQLYFRRAKAWALLAGDRRSAYATLAHRLYDEER
jgi:alkylation response protein AidB-like acyl-CoA dehydrogenase